MAQLEKVPPAHAQQVFVADVIIGINQRCKKIKKMCIYFFVSILLA
jgi:hypothetical protein